MDLDKITIKDLLEPEVTAIGLAGRKLKEMIDEFNEYVDEKEIDRKHVKIFLESRSVLDEYANDSKIVAEQISKDNKISKSSSYSLNFQIKSLKNAKNHREYLKNNYINLYTKELRNEYNLDVEQRIYDAFYENMEKICE